MAGEEAALQRQTTRQEVENTRETIDEHVIDPSPNDDDGDIQRKTNAGGRRTISGRTDDKRRPSICNDGGLKGLPTLQMTPNIPTRTTAASKDYADGDGRCIRDRDH